MSEAAKKPRVPYEEYLRQERLEQQKHEWIDGEVYAMTYPDLAIVCGRPEADPDALTNPTMIVEALAEHRGLPSRPGESLTLESIGCTIAIGEIYEMPVDLDE